MTGVQTCALPIFLVDLATAQIPQELINDAEGKTPPSAMSTPAPIRVRLRARTVRADWMTVVFWSSPGAWRSIARVLVSGPIEPMGRETVRTPGLAWPWFAE